MIPRRTPVRRNVRRSGTRQRRDQNLLEVSIRSRLATRQRNRRLLRWCTKLVLVVLLVVGSIWGAREGLRRYFWENPKYHVAVVEIHNSGSGVTREMVLSATGLEVGQHIFRASLSKAEKALGELPQVEKVEVSRVLPNKIAVAITERRPVAWLADPEAADPTASEHSYLVDARGILFKPKRQVGEYLRLPVIYGAQPENYLPGEIVNAPEVAAALELISLNETSHTFEIASLDLSKGYCVIVTTHRKREYTFALDELPKQMERCATAMELAARNQVEIQTINLMMQRNVPVTYTRVGNDLPPEPVASAPVEKEPEAQAPVAAPAKAAPRATTPAKPVRRAAPAAPKARPAKAAPVKKNTAPVRRAEPVIRKAEPVRSAVPVAGVAGSGRIG